jgi:hypothetical protein
MRKYKNGKTKPLRTEQQRALDIRKSANHTTVERQFGADFPKFGASLGTAYDSANGIISKTNRAESVK